MKFKEIKNLDESKRIERKKQKQIDIENDKKKKLDKIDDMKKKFKELDENDKKIKASKYIEFPYLEELNEKQITELRELVLELSKQINSLQIEIDYLVNNKYGKSIQQ